MNIRSVGFKKMMEYAGPMGAQVAPELNSQISPKSDGVSLSGIQASGGTDRISALTAGLQENYAVGGSRSSLGIDSEKKLKNDLRNFEERLPTEAKETYRNLDFEKRKSVMQLGKAFPGTLIANSPLLNMMQDGRLFEKDGSGMTPLQSLTEAARPDQPDFGGKTNFVMRTLKAIDNPQQSADAKRKGAADAQNSPADFIRKAGEEYDSDLTLGKPSDWDRSALEPN